MSLYVAYIYNWSVELEILTIKPFWSSVLYLSPVLHTNRTNRNDAPMNHVFIWFLNLRK